VTRAPLGQDVLSERLRELGAAVRELKAIALSPPADPGPLDDALLHLDRFRWVVFASATAVDRVLERSKELGVSRAALSARSLAAVGPATGARLLSEVRAPDLIPPEATGEALARSLGPFVGGKRVLLPRAAEGRPEILKGLSAAGAEVTAVEAYRTLPAPAETLICLASWIERAEVDAVAFASPSAVRAVFEALGPRAGLLGRVLLAAIGPTTAGALREVGLSAGVVADRHTGRDLADSIAASLGPG